MGRHLGQKIGGKRGPGAALKASLIVEDDAVAEDCRGAGLDILMAHMDTSAEQSAGAEAAARPMAARGLAPKRTPREA